MFVPDGELLRILLRFQQLNCCVNGGFVGWTHAVINVGDSLTVAIAQEFDAAHQNRP